MPKLRTATAESEKAVLQNAVTATDQQIDQLVYDLYGLTEDEIKLVEGGQRNAPGARRSRRLNVRRPVSTGIHQGLPLSAR